jgi:uncharacterized protein YjbJ (UPF0337 family)
MNWERIEGNWQQAKTGIKERWDKLTDHQLDRIPGTRNQFVENIQATYGITRTDAERQVKAWETKNQNDNEYGEMPPGARDQLIANIQTSFGTSKDEAERQALTWGTRNAGEIAEYESPTGGPWEHWPHT